MGHSTTSTHTEHILPVAISRMGRDTVDTATTSRFSIRVMAGILIIRFLWEMVMAYIFLVVGTTTQQDPSKIHFKGKQNGRDNQAGRA